MQSQTLRHHFLLVGMDVVHVADVAGRNEGRVLLLTRELGLSKLQFIEALPVGRQLHEIQLEIWILEFLRPAVIQCVHLVAVNFRFPGVVAALVPDEALGRVRHERRHHGVPQHSRLLHPPGDHAPGHALIPLVGNGIIGGLFQFRMILIPRSRSPSVDIRSAPVGVDDAYWNAKAGIQLQRVIKTDRRQRP